jgi:murein DD-endopeptidase MepM/ murein hydrolase activator NlpD
MTASTSKLWKVQPKKKSNFFIPLVNLSLLTVLLYPPVQGALEGVYQGFIAVDRVSAWLSPNSLPTLNPEQNQVISEVIRAGKDQGLGDRDLQVGVITVLQESGAKNLDHGDDWFFAATGGGKSDSVGAFQQRDMPPWNKRDRRNVYEAATTFFEELKKVEGRNSMELWQVAARVQKPAKQYERHYEQWEGDAKQIVSAKLPPWNPLDLIKGIPGVNVDKGWLPPISGASITSPYGMRVHPITGQLKMHNGIDFGADMGAPTLATRSGEVTASGDNKDGYGITVKIDHGDGYESLYAHLSRSIVTPGQKVNQGEVIGEAGSTGNSTGVHSHFEVRKDGILIDPASLLTKK